MEFWREKRVLLTGHTGFKGSWLALWLQSLGVNLVGFSLTPPTTPNLFEIAQIEKGMTSIIGNIGDLGLLQKILKKYQPEILIHMAAQSLVRYSYQEPVKTYATNVMGSVNLLEAVRLNDSVKVLINVTSDKCYANQEMTRGYCETDNLGGHDPYSNSKACAELVTQAYRDSYFREREIGIATVRAGNVIGGGDWGKDRLVPDIIYACINQETILLRYPDALRPWQHVLEALNGYLMLAERLYESPASYSGSWNFGPNEEDKSVSWVVNKINQLWKNQSINWILDENSHLPESELLRLDSTKARINLKWKPRWRIEQALNKTVEWYQAYAAKENMRDKTLLQIKAFIQHMAYSVPNAIA
jgi:CDP-glucose 4,6-dehydratase